MDFDRLIGTLCGVIAGLVFALGFSTYYARINMQSFRQEAIDHGAAEWRCDPATGETEFVWRSVRAVEAASNQEEE